MSTFIDFISQPWHWSISGLGIVVVMFLLLRHGGQFGVSSNLRTMCSIAGAGKHADFFNFDWKSQIWNLTFVGGAIIGGFIASEFLMSDQPVQIASSTTEYLNSVGVTVPTTIEEGKGYVPAELFDLDKLANPLVLLMLIGGGFLVGFGTRYAGGCTSGHAISGLSNLQVPSLIAVVGFFIGGLTMTWLILPHLLRIISNYA